MTVDYHQEPCTGMWKAHEVKERGQKRWIDNIQEDVKENNLDMRAAID